MLYGILRALARVALNWYYSDILVQGRERIPFVGPVLVVANHPNALVDALLVGTSIRRRVLLTAKATLFDHPVLAPLLSAVGVVPLRRAKDAAAADGVPSPARNTDAFLRVTEALLRKQVVLIFPEGISHDEPTLAPIKTGAARMALTAEAEGVRGLRILPVGLVFEEKERPRSRVLVRIGEPLEIELWLTQHESDVATLTQEIDARLRLVTLNFASSARARQSVQLASALAALSGEPASLNRKESLLSETTIAQRVGQATEALEHASPSLSKAAEVFVNRLHELEKLLAANGIALAEARVSPHLHHGVWFVLREGLIALLALPIALFGRLIHWFPLWLARGFALRSLARDASRDQPAMRTLLSGVVAIVAWYLVLGVGLTRGFGWHVAILWIVAAFVAGQVDLLLSDRLAHALRRARTFLALRRNAELRSSVSDEIDELVQEALRLERALDASARNARRGSIASE